MDVRAVNALPRELSECLAGVQISFTANCNQLTIGIQHCSIVARSPLAECVTFCTFNLASGANIVNWSSSVDNQSRERQTEPTDR